MAEFDLSSYMAERKAWIETTLLDDVLPAEGERPAQLSAAMRHAVEAGGKRIRPILCLASAEAAGGSASDALFPACAMELLHSYTLVHDDLPCMDDDIYRRGRLSAWAKFGETTAALAGDSLQALAFATLAHTPEKRHGALARLVETFGEAGTGVVRGQVEDILFGASPTRETVDFVFEHKTGDLFKAACKAGAIAAGADDAAVAALAAFGARLGLAFQLQDDLLDAAQSGADPDELSCLRVMGADEARALARSATESALAALEGLPGPAEPLAAIARSLMDRKA